MERSGQFKSWLEDLEGWKEEKKGEFGDLIIAIHVGIIQGSARCGSWFANCSVATLPDARPGDLGTIALR